MKILVLGGVAAGTKAAAKLLREDRSCEVTVLTKGKDISYAGCGLPYYVGGVIEDKAQLIVNTPEKYEKLTGAKVLTETEAVAVHPAEHTVEAKDLKTGETATYSYDKLVIATGASPFVPDVPGLNVKNVFVMRTPDDAIALREAVEAGGIKRAVVAGGGFIGLEVAENLALKGVRVSVIDFAPHVLPSFLDPELCEYVENRMAEAGVMPMTGVALEGVEGAEKVEKVLTSKRAMKADALVLAIGIRPNTAFLEGSGIEMFKGTILTDGHMRTNAEDIYAAGDCAMVTNRQTGKPAWSPMGSTANISARVLAENLAGKDVTYPGVLGTGVAKLPGGINAGRTGLTETAARAEGYDVVTASAAVDDKALHRHPPLCRRPERALQQAGRRAGVHHPRRVRRGRRRGLRGGGLRPGPVYLREALHGPDHHRRPHGRLRQRGQNSPCLQQGKAGLPGPEPPEILRLLQHQGPGGRRGVHGV